MSTTRGILRPPTLTEEKTETMNPGATTPSRFKWPPLFISRPKSKQNESNDTEEGKIQQTMVNGSKHMMDASPQDSPAKATKGVRRKKGKDKMNVDSNKDVKLLKLDEKL